MNDLLTRVKPTCGRSLAATLSAILLMTVLLVILFMCCSVVLCCVVLCCVVLLCSKRVDVEVVYLILVAIV